MHHFNQDVVINGNTIEMEVDSRRDILRWDRTWYRSTIVRVESSDSIPVKLSIKDNRLRYNGKYFAYNLVLDIDLKRSCAQVENSSLYVVNNSFYSEGISGYGFSADINGPVGSVQIVNNSFDKQALWLIERSKHCNDLNTSFLLSQNEFKNISRHCQKCQAVHIEKYSFRKESITFNISKNSFNFYNGSTVVYMKAAGHGALTAGFTLNKFSNVTAQYNFLADIKKSDKVFINATYNWWDSKDTSEIKRKIYDNLHDNSLTKVSFEPFYLDSTMTRISGKTDDFSPDANIIGGALLKNITLKPKEYRVNLPIIIPKGILLVIPPGAVLKFEEISGITVEGKFAFLVYHW